MGYCWSKDTKSGLTQFNNPMAIDCRLSSSRRSQNNGEAFVQRCLSRKPSDCQLKRGSFDKLPDNLFKLVLEQLPSSTLVQMRCVCKKWNTFILSSAINSRNFTAKNVLFNFSSAELTLRVYSPRPTHWELEKKSLSFLLDTSTRIGDLADVMWAPTFSFRCPWFRLVASGGGLLCFTSSSYLDWALIVCNPLTKKWRRLQMPFANLQRDQLSADNCMPPPAWAVKLWNSKNRVMDWQAKLDEELAVCIIVDSDDSERSSYKLIVAGLYAGSQRTTLLYQSKTGVWRKIADVPVLQSKVDSRFCSRAIACNGNMYCLTGEFQDRFAILRRPTRLLKCDLQSETWSEVSLRAELGFPNDLVEHCDRILLLTHDRYNVGNSLSFYELRESDPELCFSPADIPKMITAWLNDCRKQSNFHFSVRCLGIKNVMYISTKMDKDHKVLVYNASDKTCTATKSPKSADYIYDSGWQVFSPAFHGAL